MPPQALFSLPIPCTAIITSDLVLYVITNPIHAAVIYHNFHMGRFPFLPHHTNLPMHFQDVYGTETTSTFQHIPTATNSPPTSPSSQKENLQLLSCGNPLQCQFYLRDISSSITYTLLFLTKHEVTELYRLNIVKIVSFSSPSQPHSDYHSVTSIPYSFGSTNQRRSAPPPLNSHQNSSPYVLFSCFIGSLLKQYNWRLMQTMKYSSSDTLYHQIYPSNPNNLDSYNIQPIIHDGPLQQENLNRSDTNYQQCRHTLCQDCPLVQLTTQNDCYDLTNINSQYSALLEHNHHRHSTYTLFHAPLLPLHSYTQSLSLYNSHTMGLFHVPEHTISLATRVSQASLKSLVIVTSVCVDHPKASSNTRWDSSQPIDHFNVSNTVIFSPSLLQSTTQPTHATTTFNDIAFLFDAPKSPLLFEESSQVGKSKKINNNFNPAIYTPAVFAHQMVPIKYSNRLPISFSE